MVTSIVENDTAAKFGNSPQKTGEPLDHAKLFSGKALEFDGVSDVMSWTELILDDDFTFATWVYIETFNTQFSSLLGHVGTYGASNTIGFRDTNGNRFHIRAGSSSGGVSNLTTPMIAGTWNRFVFTRDKSASTGKLYINGVLDHTLTAPSNGTTDDATGSIFTYSGIANDFRSKSAGAWGSSANYHLGCKMSDYQVWDKVWELDDVTYDYENPETLITGNASVTSGITTSNLKLWYPMNDTGVRSPQTVVFDAAGTNNTTKNHAATTFTGDDLMAANRGTFVNSGGELRTGSELSSGAATNHAFYEITAQGYGSEMLSGDSITFASGVGNWSTSTWAHGDEATFDHTTNSGKGTLSHAAGNNNATVSYTLTTEAGRDYQVSFDYIQSYGQLYVRVGTSAGGVQDKGSVTINTNNSNWEANNETITFTFRASTTTSYIAFHHFDGGSFGGSGQSASQFDNFTIKKFVDFTTYGAPDNYPGTIFQMNNSNDVVPTFDANNKAYLTVINWDASTGNMSNVGPELCGDPGFDTAVSASTTGTHWTTSADWTIGSGVATHDGSGTSNLTSSALGLIDGKTYRVRITVGDAGTTTARVKLMLGSSSVLAHSGSYLDEGSHSFFATAGGDNDTLIIRHVGGEPTVDNVSIKQTDVLVHTGNAGGTLKLNNSTDGNTTEDLVVGRQYTFVANAHEEGVGSPLSTGIRAHNGTSAPNAWTPTTDGDITQTFTLDTSNDTYPNLSVFAQDEGEYTIINSITLKETGIASGWTDADQQQTIPQTALMNGSVKSFVGNGLYSNSIPSLSYPFTLSCWVYKTDDAAYGVYLVDQNVSTIYFGIALGADDKVYLQASNGSNKNTYSNSTYTSQWVHVVASFESATDRNLYINGLPNTDNENNDSVTYEDIDRISVGYRGASSPTYSGSEIIVDEVCVFSTGLNDSEALELYNNGAPLNATNHSLGTTNLVGYWQNNQLESTGKWKDQISTNHLTANDTPSTIFFQEGVTANLDTQGFATNRTHPSNGAAWFDGGSSYINAGSGPTIDNIWDGGGTVECWIKAYSIPGSGLEARIFDKRGTSSGWNFYLAAESSNTCKLALYQDWDNDIYWITTGRPVTFGQWHHVVCMLNNNPSTNNATMYVDGTRVAMDTPSRSSANTTRVDDSSNDLLIGKYAGNANYQFDGFIDEVRVYNRLLTDGGVAEGAVAGGEIKKNYKHGKSKHKNS